MDALPYVDTLFKEYLLFRGFTSTLQTFSKDLTNDPGCGFQAERIAELIFRKLIPGLDCQQLVDFLEFLNMGLYSRLDSRYESLVTAVEADLLRLFLVTAHSAKRPDKIAEFFKLYGPQLLSNSSSSSSKSGLGFEDAADWKEWFLLPYLQHPEREQRFQVYFSAEWASLLETSFRNFLSGVMRCLPLPAVLRFNTDRRLRLALQQQVHMLQAELEQCRKQLADMSQQQQQKQQRDQTQQQQQQQVAHQQAQQQHGLGGPAQQQQTVPSPTQQQQQQHASSLPQQHEEHHQLPFDIESSSQAAAAAAAAGDGHHTHTPIPLVHTLHKRDLSLGDWQQQQQQQRGGSLPGTSRLQHNRRSSTGTTPAAAAAAAADPEGREMQVMHHAISRSEGSGLFELLPMTHQQSLGGAAAAAAGAAAGLDHNQQQQQQQGGVSRVVALQRRHSRTASLGGISFDPTQLETQEDVTTPAAAAAPATQDGSSSAQPGGLSAALAAAAAAAAAAAPSDQTAAAAAAAADSSTVPSAESSRRSSSSTSTAQMLSTSPVMSLSGVHMASSAAGLRSRHTSAVGSSGSSSSNPTHWDSSTSFPARDAATSDAAAAVTPLIHMPGPLKLKVTVAEPPQIINLNPSSSTSSSSNGSSSSVTCVAFSPSGGNVATAYGDGLVSIWSPPDVQGNPNRRASFACGVPVTSIAWDTRADKLMLIGCAGGGGVRAWHADTKRIMADVGSETGFPYVVAVAACPAEPSFVVAANNKQLTSMLPTDTSATSAAGTSSSSSNSISGRLVLYNSRSFKRSAVLALPGDVGLVSVAYSSSGGHLAVGTAAGTALLYEPSSRSSPIRVWQAAAATSSSSSYLLPVQVLWRPSQAVNSAAAAAAAASSTAVGTGSSSSPGSQAGSQAGAGSVLTLCGGVLCEWVVGGSSSSSRAPVVAIDVIATAAATVEAASAASSSQPGAGEQQLQQQQQGKAADIEQAGSTNANDNSEWSCCCAVSVDGRSCAVLCTTAAFGVLLLYTISDSSTSSRRDSSSDRRSRWLETAPQVLSSGSMLAGGCSLDWHPSGRMMVAGGVNTASGLLVITVVD